MTANSLFSVIPPVYNCTQYVSAAIESILLQTFTDFEFIYQTFKQFIIQDQK